MYVLTLPLIFIRQIGHVLRREAQSSQVTKWPHGKRTVLISLSMHILQNWDSLNPWICFSNNCWDSFKFLFSSSIISSRPKACWKLRFLQVIQAVY